MNDTNEKRKTSKKKLHKKRLVVDVICIFFWILTIFLSSYYCHLPIFSSQKGNLIFIIAVNTVISAMVGYSLWDYKAEYSKVDNILHCVLIVAVWLPLIIPSHKVVMIFDILVGLAIFIYTTFILGSYNGRIYLFALLFFDMRGIAPNLLGYFDIATVSSKAHLIIAIIISIILTVFAIGAIDNMRAKKLNIVWVIILFAFLLFLVFSIVTSIINCANYALDFSEPQKITTTNMGTEEDRVITGRGSSRIDYYIFAEVNGEKTKIKTTRMVYDQIAVGDEITVLQYDGAFSMPYYTIEPIE